MISRCTCDCTLSLSPLFGRPSCEKSRPVNLSLIRFMTATARSFNTSFASPSCPYAFSSSRSRASRRGRLGTSFGSEGTLPPPPVVLVIRSGIFSSAAVHKHGVSSRSAHNVDRQKRQNFQKDSNSLCGHDQASFPTWLAAS